VSEAIESEVQRSFRMGILSGHLPAGSDDRSNPRTKTPEPVGCCSDRSRTCGHDPPAPDPRPILDCISEILGRIHAGVRRDACHAILTAASRQLYEPIWWRSRAVKPSVLSDPRGGCETADRGLVSEVWLRKTLWMSSRRVLLAPPLTLAGFFTDGSSPRPELSLRSSRGPLIYHRMMNVIRLDRLPSHDDNNDDDERGWTEPSARRTLTDSARNVVLDLEDAIFEELLLEAIGAVSCPH
jgi:hypothetical protein